MRVKIFVEGGGDGPASIAACHQGFVAFFRRMLDGRKEITIIPCGGRAQAYKDYCLALRTREADEAIVLLVDAEEAIGSNADIWKHLEDREGDGWKKPDANANDVHLMVQCIESWFLADHAALKLHYKKGIKLERLPAPVNLSVEGISKTKVLEGLKAALRGTDYERYHKRDGFKIVGHLDPKKVCDASDRAKQMRDRLFKLTTAKK